MALEHLHRREVRRDAVGRARPDAITNRAVVATGTALSASLASAEASALPLLLVSVPVAVLLMTEARRCCFLDS